MNPPVNFFELFSLPQDFSVDKNELKATLRTLQNQYHPDRFSSRGEDEQIAAVQMSSIVNDAYQVLSSSASRAQYLLQLEGVDIQADRFINPEILMEQMELRERFEHYADNQDEDLREQSLDNFMIELDALFLECEQEFQEKSSNESRSEDGLQNLKQVLSRMLFINKLRLEVEKILR